MTMNISPLRPAFGIRYNDNPPEYPDDDDGLWQEPEHYQSTRPEPLPFPSRGLPWRRLSEEEKEQLAAAKTRRDEIKAWDRRKSNLMHTIQCNTGDIFQKSRGDYTTRCLAENSLALMEGRPEPHPEIYEEDFWSDSRVPSYDDPPEDPEDDDPILDVSG